MFHALRVTPRPPHQRLVTAGWPITLDGKMVNHNGSEADIDEPFSNPESKYTEYTENEES